MSPPGALSPIGGKLGVAIKFPRHQSRGLNSNALAYAERALSTSGRSTWALITLFVVYRISQKIFYSTPKRSFSSTPFRFCRCLYQLQRYLRSNSKVVVKRTKFWTFFALPNFKEAVPSSFIHALSPQLRGTASAKVSSSYIP